MMFAVLRGFRLPGTGFPAGSPRAPGRQSHPGKEIADVALSLSSQRRLLHFSACGIKSEGNRKGRSQRKSASDIPVKGDEKLKDPIASANEKSESSSQEEILALFRRIQSSISKRGNVVRKKRSATKESQSLKAVPDAQRQRPNQRPIKGKISSQSRDQEPPQHRGILTRDVKIVDASLSENFKPSRPPSKFVKRSPISLATLPRENARQVIGQRLPATAAGDLPVMQRIDGLKLSQLRELAKSRGIKGYSKLKKGELLELLKRLMNST